MRHGLAIWLAVSALCVAPATAVAEENIYAGDVEQAQQHLDAAQARHKTAASDIAQARADLPAVVARTQQLRLVAERRRQAAVGAVGHASAAEAAEQRRRDAATEELQAAHSAYRHELADWRGERAQWISIAALFVVAAVAFALAGAVASSRATLSGRAGERGREGAANRAGLALGSAVTLYLSGLLVVLYWVDAWRFSWWAVGAAAVGAMAICASVLVAWIKSERLALRLRRRGRAALVPVAVTMVAAVAPASVAASDARPTAPPVPAAVLTLAEQARGDAPMPDDVRKLRSSADWVSKRASYADGRYRDAADEEQRLIDLKTDAAARLERAQRSIRRWSDELSQAQKDFDRYQELLDPIDSDEDFDRRSGDSNIPDDEPPDLDYPSPTTEDFGNGSGSVGQCADGTWSDSIGRPGACSHHGGVG